MINIAADEEMRKLIRDEIRGQVVALTRDEIKAEIAEGFRRARGASDSLDPLIEKIITRVIEQHVSTWLAGFSPRDHAARLVGERVDHWINARLGDEVLEKAKKKLDEFDYKEFMVKALKNFKISL